MTEAVDPPQVPGQGWYDDGRGHIRWWDGRQWTEHVQPDLPSKARSASGDPARTARGGAERDAARQAEAARKQAARENAIERRNAERKEKDAAALLVREQKRTAKDARQAQKEADRVAKIAAREAQLAAWDELTGEKVFASSFGLTTIVLYENGYARFGATLLGTGESAAPERLLGAKTSTQIQDKSAGGRAVAAGLTMGVSLLASNEKRFIFLTLTTDKRVRVLKAEGDMLRTVDKSAMEIVARAEALIAQSASLPIAVRQISDKAVAVTERADLIEQIKRLAELRDAGVLSVDEFEAKKAELLRRI